MDEYIKREAAINAALLAKSDADITLVPGSFTNGFIEGAKIEENAILNALADIPAADVVEVVRCRDCKYRAEDDFCTGRGLPNQLVADNGFCDKGKRKDGDGEIEASLKGEQDDV